MNEEHRQHAFVSIKSACFLFMVFSITMVSSAQKKTDSVPGKVTFLQSFAETNIRGMSVISDSLVWVSGSHGWIGRITTRSGVVDWKQVKGYEQCDFRSIHAFDAEHALIVNAGSPAYILKTDNAGKTWKQVYTSADPKTFPDAIAFWDEKRGLVLGDPIDNRFDILLTADGGKTWTGCPLSVRPEAINGEACFAASGTCLQVTPDGNAWIGTGGSRASLWRSKDYGVTWSRFQVDSILQGKASQGIFSVGMQDHLNGLVAGGDYAKDSLGQGNCLLTGDGGLHWEKPSVPPGGYISCVVWYSKKGILGTGTRGSYFSADGGKRWSLLDRGSFNVCGTSPDKKYIFLAGEKGKVAKIRTWKLMSHQRKDKR